MKPNKSPGPWPTAVPITRGPLADGMTNLSRLPATDRARAFAGLKTSQPDLAQLVGRLARQFGKVALYIDTETAGRLGVRA